MAIKYSVDDVLDYLREWHSSEDVKKKFDLTHSEAFNLFNWLCKGNFVIRCRGTSFKSINTEVDCRVWFYKTK